MTMHIVLNTILLVLAAVLVFGGIFVIYLSFKTDKPSKKKRNPVVEKSLTTEEELVAALVKSIEAGDWHDSTYGGDNVMQNNVTGKKIFLRGILAGCFAGSEPFRFSDKNRLIITDAYKTYTGEINPEITSLVKEITGQDYEPDIDPDVVNEAKKNLKLWTR